MDIKEYVQIRDAMCHKNTTCSECLINKSKLEMNCSSVSDIVKWLTPENEVLLRQWYKDNVNTYMNDFKKKFPDAKENYVAHEICVCHVYGIDFCDEICNKYKGCINHWNSEIKDE